MNFLNDTQRNSSQAVLFILKANPTGRAAIRATARARGVAATELVRQGLRPFTVRWLLANA